MDNQLTLFEGKKIRKKEHKGEWWFSVVDIIEVLTDSSQPKRYWADLKKRASTETFQPFAFCEQLKLTATDGKQRATECANTEGVLRIVQSVPSPKAEPFKLWLAQTGRQELEEFENPELGFERLRELYRAKGYTDEWIQNRLKTIDIRKELTDEWQNRGIKEGQEYAILTATIAKETFGLTPTEHRQLKNLTAPQHNLRDNMTNLELIFTALGEEVTRSITVENDAQGFNDALDAAQQGGSIAGDARRRVEERGRKVISSQNFLNQNSPKTLQEGDEAPPQ